MSVAPPGEGASLVQQAMNAVRDHIRDHDMTVGATLPGEGQFAADLGVSRAVMREAFGALAALGLIDVANGRRARVGAIDGSVMAASIDHAIATSQVSIAEIWDVRRTLEVGTAVLAAQNRSDAQAAAIVRLADEMAAAGDDLGAITQADVALHEEIARATQNRLFVQIIRSFAPMMRVAVPSAWRTRVTEGERSAVIARHRALAQAIADRDVEAARDIMNAHFDRSVGDLLRKEAHDA